MARIPRKLAGIGATDLANATAFDAYIGPAREVTVDHVRGIVALHDGSTPGGKQYKFADLIPSGGTTGQVAARASGGGVEWVDQTGGSGGGAPLAGFITGLTVSNNATDANNDIDVAAGVAASSGADPVLIELASGLTKRLDAGWAVGNNQGMLDTGTKAVDTWYHVFAIKRSDTGVVDILASTSVNSPTMPTNYDTRRLIMSVLTNSSGNIIAFIQNGASVQWATPRLSVSATNPGTFVQLAPIDVPEGIACWAALTAMVSNDSDKTAVIFSDPARPAPTLSLGFGPIPQLRSIVNGVSTIACFPIKTNSSRQVRYQCDLSNSTTAVRFQCDSYIHPRGVS